MAESLAKEFAKENEVTVWTSWYKGEKKIEDRDGFTIRRINAFRKRKDCCGFFEMFLFLVFSAFPLVKLAARERPDIVVCHFAAPVGPLGYLLHKLLGIPYIIHTHGGDIPGFIPEQTGVVFSYIKWLMKPIWNSAGIVINNSRGAEDLARKSFPNAKLTHIRNGIDLKNFQEIKKNCSRSGGEKMKFVTVGRAVAQKGFKYLVAALKNLKSDGVGNIHCRIIGDGELRGELEKQINGAGLSEIAEITGWLDHDQVIRHLSDSDIYVSSSINEGMSIALLEAMACGLPIVATDVIGNGEVVKDGSVGFLVKPRDPSALSCAMKKLAEDRDLRNEFIGNIQKGIENYSWEAIAKEHLLLYGKILNNEI